MFEFSACSFVGINSNDTALQKKPNLKNIASDNWVLEDGADNPQRRPPPKSVVSG